MVVMEKPSTPDGLPKKLQVAFIQARSGGRRRLSSGGSICSQTLTQQQRQYRGKHWEFYLSCVTESTVPETDGTFRNVCDWHKFALTIITELEEKHNGKPPHGNQIEHGTEEWEDWCYANTILEALENGSYNEDECGEWHHMKPLCMHGTNEDWKQWVRLPHPLHVHVHRAHVHFFPNSTSMKSALHYTAFGKGGKSLDIETLDDPVRLIKVSSCS